MAEKQWFEYGIGERAPGFEEFAAPDPHDDETVAVISPTGERGTVKRGELPLKLRAGFELESPEGTEFRRAQKRQEGRAFRTGLETFADTVTFGGTTALADDQQKQEMRERRAVHPGSALAGTVAGAVVPIGAASAASAAGRLAKGAVGAGRLGTVAGLAAEGGVFGLGQGLSELALSEDPVTAERALATIGSNVLFGAAFGAGVGSAGSLLAEGANAARNGMRAMAGRFASDEATAAFAAKYGHIPDDVLKMDLKNLGKATDEEILRLRTEADAAIPKDSVLRYSAAEINAAKKVAQAEARTALRAESKAVVDDLLRYADETDAAFKAAEKELKINGLGKSNDKIRKALDDPKGWLDSDFQPLNMLSKLRAQETKLVKAAAAELSPAAREAVDALVESNRAAQGRLQKFTDAIAKPSSARLDELAEAARTLPDREAMKAARPTSDRLKILDEARESFTDRAAMQREAAKSGLVEKMGTKVAKATATSALTGGAMALGVPGLVAFPLGAAVAEAGVNAIVKRFGGRLARGARQTDEALAAGVKKFFQRGERGARAAAPTVAKTLGAVTFATPEQVAQNPGRPTGKTSNPKVREFRKRAEELNSVVNWGPDGKAKASIPAMQQVTDRLAGVMQLSPKLADEMAMAAARRLEFLANKLPKKPGEPDMPVGPDTWVPSDMQLSEFARYVDAVENPTAVIDRMASSTMTPEDAEALKAVYPGLYDQVRGQIMDKLPELRETLPYEKRLMLSIFFEVPVDPAMSPGVLSQLQGNYANEPDTEGGTQPAPAKFTSLRGNFAPQPTPSQARGSTPV